MQNEQQKWEKASRENNYWDSAKARKIQKAESKIIIKFLKKLKLQKYNILEIGCGNGYVGHEIIKWLLKENLDFTYHFTDLLPSCLEKTKKNLLDLNIADKIKYSTLDVYKADKIFGSHTQDIVVSTGFASAASYKNAIPIVSKILKPNGILISDFINHLSPWVFLPNIGKFKSRLFSCKKHAKDPNSKYYHFGRLGLKEYFENHDLQLLKIKTVRPQRNPLIAMFKKR